MTEKPVNVFLTELSSSSATPGGGSAAALIGSMGAALVSMVANLTKGKKKYESVEPEVLKVLEESELLRVSLEDAVKKDVEAFDEVMSAYALPKETDEEKSTRSEKIQEALKIAIDWIKQIVLELEHNISIEDLDLFNIVDTPLEAVEIIEEFYKKYTLKPNF